MILKDVSATAALRSEMNLSCRIEVKLIVHQDPAFVGLGETAQTVQGERFPCAARPEKHRYTGLGTQMDIQLKRF